MIHADCADFDGAVRGAIGNFERMLQKVRQDHHLQLRHLITALEAVPRDTPVRFDFDEMGPIGGFIPVIPDDEHFGDIAVRLVRHSRMTAADILINARACLGMKFRHMDGSTFRVREDAPLWAAPRCMSNRSIVRAAYKNGEVILLTLNVRRDD